MKNSNKSISVVVPYYNRSKFLKRLLDSIAIQTLPAEKVYIVDNGSSLEDTLKAWDIIQSHKLHGKCLFTSSLGKGNANYARNLGYELAESKYVAFLDSDDWWEKEHLEQSIACLQDSDKAAIYSGVMIHSEKSVTTNLSVNIDNYNDPFSVVMSPEGHIAQTSSYIVDKQKLQNSVAWSEQLKRHQDLDYFANIYYNTQGWHYLPQANVNMDKIEGGVDIKKIDYNSMMQYYNKWNHLFSDKVRKYYLKNVLFLTYEANANPSVRQFYQNELRKYGFINNWRDRLIYSRAYYSKRRKLVNMLDSFKLKQSVQGVITHLKLNV